MNSSVQSLSILNQARRDFHNMDYSEAIKKYKLLISMEKEENHDNRDFLRHSGCTTEVQDV